MEAREVIKQGGFRRIGDGQSTNIWMVPWLPCRINGYLTTAVSPELDQVQVENLMEEGSKNWDETVLNDILNERDVQLIKRIPIPRVTKSDSRFWLLEESGKFTVRSCYRNLHGGRLGQMQISKENYGLLIFRERSRILYGGSVEHVFLQLWTYRGKWQISARCVRGVYVDHILFDCSFARAVWTNMGMQDIIQTDQEAGDMMDV